MAMTMTNRPFPMLAVIMVVMTTMFIATGGASKGKAPRIFAEGLTYAQASARSKETGKPVFAVFSADWCRPCQMYKKGALADARVEAFVKEKMIPVYIDVDKDAATARKFGASSIPVTAVIKNDVRVQGAIGVLESGELMELLERAAADAAKR